jgi:hypothetical protein
MPERGVNFLTGGVALMRHGDTFAGWSMSGTDIILSASVFSLAKSAVIQGCDDHLTKETRHGTGLMPVTSQRRRFQSVHDTGANRILTAFVKMYASGH